MDAANAMVSVPGDFGSYGHDYRADMVRFVHDAYGLPEASDAQLDRIDQQLRSLELERAQRIKAQHAHAAPNRPRTGPPAWRHLPAYHSAPDALAEPGGFEDDDKSIHHPPPPGEDAHQYSVKPASSHTVTSSLSEIGGWALCCPAFRSSR